MESITISHSSTAEALSAAVRLNLILGRDCKINGTTLTIKLSAIDRIIERSLDYPDNLLDDAPAAPQPPKRLDRVIDIPTSTQAQLERLENELDLMRVVDPVDKAIAYQQYKAKRQQLRDDIVQPWISADILSGSTVIYAQTGPWNNAEWLDVPDGERRSPTMLIHGSHAPTPEEHHLRELQSPAQYIASYRVPGLDDEECDRAHEPRYKLDASVWRSMIVQRHP